MFKIKLYYWKHKNFKGMLILSTKVNIISGFLGAGKTTFLKKVISNMEGKIALIENEFGDVGIDGDLVKNKFTVKEIYAGCICCSLVNDLKKGIKELILKYNPDNIFIEPSGVGSLSQIVKSCENFSKNSDFDIEINNLITIVDVSTFQDYSQNFGSFYLDQIKNANIILFSHINEVEHNEFQTVISKIRLYNEKAFILEEDWYLNDGKNIIEIINGFKTCNVEVKEKRRLLPASRVFNTVSCSNLRVFSKEEFGKILSFFSSKEHGFILRAKGMVQLKNNKFIYFDYTPYHNSLKYLDKCDETKIVVIGNKLKKQEILENFS